MNLNRAIIFGAIAGVAGAALWAAIAYFANVEIGWLAWGIGGAVGFACAQGAGYGSRLIGTTAALITVVALLLGKVATVELLVNQEFGDPQALLEQTIAELNDETLTSWLADDVVAGYEERGEKVDWPPGVNPRIASTQVEYPAEIWKIAAQQWDAFSQDQKQAYHDAVERAIRENFTDNFDEARGLIREEGFFNSFSGVDLLFFGLAIYTAFSVGQMHEVEEEAIDEPADSEEPQSEPQA